MYEDPLTVDQIRSDVEKKHGEPFYRELLEILTVIDHIHFSLERLRARLRSAEEDEGAIGQLLDRVNALESQVSELEEVG